MLARVYLALGILVLAGYVGVSLAGWEFGNPHRQRLPAAGAGGGWFSGRGGSSSQGRTPGGSSSSHGWPAGLGGGK